MDDRLETLNAFFAALPAWLRRHRRVVWSVVLVITLIVGAGAGRLKVDMSMEAFFVEDDPVWRLYERFKETFGSDEGVYIVYEARDGDIFSPASLKAARAVQDALLRARGVSDDDPWAPLQHILDVDTIVNVSYLEVQEDTLVSRDFVDEIPGTAPEREALRQVALRHESYPDFYVSRDTRYGGIWVRTDLGLEDADETADATSEDDTESFLGEALEAEFAEPPREKAPNTTQMTEHAAFASALFDLLDDETWQQTLEFHPVGNPIVMGFFSDVLGREIGLLVGGAMLIMMVVLGVLFRSASGVLWPLALVVLTTLLAIGWIGWVGITLTLMVSALVLLILVVGIADAVHILSGYLYYRRAGSDHARALEEVYRESGLACLLTSVTTAAGLLTLVIIPIPPISGFGVAAAVGVVIAFALTALLLPLMLDLWAPYPREDPSSVPLRNPVLQHMLARLEPLTERYALPIVLVFAVIGVAGAVGVARVQVDTNMVEIIRPGLPIRDAHDLVDRVMGGTQGMEIYLDLGQPDALKDPVVLNTMEAMQRRLEVDHPRYVVRTDSIVDVTKDSFRALNEARPEMYRIPQERTLVAQTLLLFDMANPDDRELMVPDDYSEGRITIRMLNYGSQEYVEFFDEVQSQVEAVFEPLRERYPDMDVGITGNLPLMMTMTEHVGRAQIQSFALVLVVVTVLLLFVFGSVRAGLVAMVPNVYPALVTFGVMGLFGFPLDADTLILAPMVIGISVDDTIHFLTHYRSALARGSDVRAAIGATVAEVGQAITFTSVILTVGFLILVRSNHVGMAHFGLLTAIAFGTALIADLLLFPALLKICGVRFGRSSHLRLRDRLET